MFKHYCIIVVFLTIIVGGCTNNKVNLSVNGEATIQKNIAFYFPLLADHDNYFQPQMDIVEQLISDPFLSIPDGLIVEDISIGDVIEAQVRWRESNPDRYTTVRGFKIPISFTITRDNAVAISPGEYEIKINFPEASSYTKSTLEQLVEGNIDQEQIYIPYYIEVEDGTEYLRNFDPLSSHIIAIIVIED